MAAMELIQILNASRKTSADYAPVAESEEAVVTDDNDPSNIVTKTTAPVPKQRRLRRRVCLAIVLFVAGIMAAWLVRRSRYYDGRRIYKSCASNSARWDRFPLRPDDIIVTTAPKSGTTWMLNMIGTVVYGTPDYVSLLNRTTLNDVSPWLDALFTTRDRVYRLYERQSTASPRIIKTHTPLDGLPRRSAVRYVSVVRHPLDVAVSMHDMWRNSNATAEREVYRDNWRWGDKLMCDYSDKDDDDDEVSLAEYLEWWIFKSNQSGSLGLRDFCRQAMLYWGARREPNFHLFHYWDLWTDLRQNGLVRLHTILRPGDPPPGEATLRAWADALSLDGMRRRANETAPEAGTGTSLSDEGFFRHGGRRDWSGALTPCKRATSNGIRELVGDEEAAAWILNGSQK